MIPMCNRPSLCVLPMGKVRTIARVLKTLLGFSSYKLGTCSVCLVVLNHSHLFYLWLWYFQIYPAVVYNFHCILFSNHLPPYLYALHDRYPVFPLLLSINEQNHEFPSLEC